MSTTPAYQYYLADMGRALASSSTRPVRTYPSIHQSTNVHTLRVYGNPGGMKCLPRDFPKLPV